MKLAKENLGKVSITIEKNYHSVDKEYDKLVVIEEEGQFRTFISRKPVPVGTELTNREFWLPFSSVKESIVIDYNKFKQYIRTGEGLLDYSIVTRHIKDRTVTGNKIAESTITFINIADEAITLPKINKEAIDTTLTKEGHLAEAKHTGERLLNIEGLNVIKVPSTQSTVLDAWQIVDKKGNIHGVTINTYKDKSIDAIWLSIHEDDLQPENPEVKVDNPRYLNIVYNKADGTQQKVSIPLASFVTEAEFSKNGFKVIDGVVNLKISSDITTSRYFHFNEDGNITLDGFEERILEDLGSFEHSKSGDGTMWGVFKEHEILRDKIVIGEIQKVQNKVDEVNLNTIKQAQDNAIQAIDNRETEILSKTDASNISANTEGLESNNVQDNLNETSNKLIKQNNKLSELEYKVGINLTLDYPSLYGRQKIGEFDAYGNIKYEIELSQAIAGNVYVYIKSSNGETIHQTCINSGDIVNSSSFTINEADKLTIEASNWNSEIRPSLHFQFSSNNILDCKNDVAQLRSDVETKFYNETKKLGLIDTMLFELGNITMSNTGYTYSNSSTRLRTKQNDGIYFDQGTLLRSDSLVFYVGWQNEDGTYSNSESWVSEFRIPYTAKYVILARYNQDASIEVNAINSLEVISFSSQMSDIIKRKAFDIEDIHDFTENYINSKDGSLVHSVNFRCYTFENHNYTKIEASLYSGDNIPALVAFYRDNDVFFKGEQAKAGINNISINVPVNVKTIKICTRYVDYKESTFSVYGYKEEKLPIVHENTNVITDYITGYIAINGDVNPASESKEITSGFIPVKPGEHLVFLCTQNGSVWTAYAFYDKNHNIVGSRYTSDSVNKRLGNYRYCKNSISVPDNSVYYIRVSYRSYGLNDARLFRVDTFDGRVALEDYEKYIDSIVNSYIDYNVFSNIKTINHRGYVSAPENTLPAYILSRKMGFMYVETDVQFTSDNVPILLHDATIDRTSTGSGNISSLTFEQVRTYDFGSWKNPMYTGTKIPSFEEFILLCKNIGLKPYIEIKASTQEQLRMLVDIVLKYGMRNNVTFISFDYESLLAIKQFDEFISLGYVISVIEDDTVNKARNLKTSFNDVSININREASITESFIQSCINAKVRLEAWTVDSMEQYNRLPKYVDGITTNQLLINKVLAEAELYR